MKRPAKPFGLRDQNQEITRLHAGDEIWFDPSNGRVTLMRSDKSLATGEQRLCDGTHLDLHGMGSLRGLEGANSGGEVGGRVAHLAADPNAGDRPRGSGEARQGLDADGQAPRGFLRFRAGLLRAGAERPVCLGADAFQLDAHGLVHMAEGAVNVFGQMGAEA